MTKKIIADDNIEIGYMNVSNVNDNALGIISNQLNIQVTNMEFVDLSGYRRHIR